VSDKKIKGEKTPISESPSEEKVEVKGKLRDSSSGNNGQRKGNGG